MDKVLAWENEHRKKVGIILCLMLMWEPQLNWKIEVIIFLHLALFNENPFSLQSSHAIDISASILFHTPQDEEFVVFLFMGYAALGWRKVGKCTWSRPITSPARGSIFNTANYFLVQWNKWFFFSYMIG